MLRPAPYPQRVRVVELSPRDGLQNEKSTVSIPSKIQLVQDLIDAGLTCIEVGSFVSPKWVPQMAGTAEVLSRFVAMQDRLELPVLTPNMKGLESAIECGARTVAVFPATTEAFSRANLNGTRDEAFGRFSQVAKAAISGGRRVRGYVSCAVHCPYEGWVDPEVAAELAASLMQIGCFEVSVCDTTGRSTPERTERMINAVIGRIGKESVAVHFHDTFGMALENTRVSLRNGISSVDACVSGLGGCPYSPGASGNLDTVTLVRMLNELHVETGIDLDRLILAGKAIRDLLK